MPESDKKLPTLEGLQQQIDDMSSKGTRKSMEDSGDTSGQSVAQTANLAWSVVSGATVGILGGYALDRWLGTSPILLIIGFFIGFAAGVYILVRKTK